jgi:hypothetical protein
MGPIKALCVSQIVVAPAREAECAAVDAEPIATQRRRLSLRHGVTAAIRARRAGRRQPVSAPGTPA